jgi:hypothetical protein
MSGKALLRLTEIVEPLQEVAGGGVIREFKRRSSHSGCSGFGRGVQGCSIGQT